MKFPAPVQGPEIVPWTQRKMDQSMAALIPGNLSPRRAVVTPRARKIHGGAAVAVEQLVRSLLNARARGFVVLTGQPGIGKTTALQHLAITLPADAPVKFLDNPSTDQ